LEIEDFSRAHTGLAGVDWPQIPELRYEISPIRVPPYLLLVSKRLSKEIQEYDQFNRQRVQFILDRYISPRESNKLDSDLDPKFLKLCQNGRFILDADHVTIARLIVSLPELIQVNITRIFSTESTLYGWSVSQRGPLEDRDEFALYPEILLEYLPNLHTVTIDATQYHHRNTKMELLAEKFPKGEIGCLELAYSCEHDHAPDNETKKFIGQDLDPEILEVKRLTAHELFERGAYCTSEISPRPVDCLLLHERTVWQIIRKGYTWRGGWTYPSSLSS